MLQPHDQMEGQGNSVVLQPQFTFKKLSADLDLLLHQHRFKVRGHQSWEPWLKLHLRGTTLQITSPPDIGFLEEAA